MKNDDFKKLDDAWMKELEGLRREALPLHATRGFTEAVKSKILEKKKAPKPWMRWHVPAAALVPVFAVLVLAVTVTLKNAPESAPIPKPSALRIEQSTAAAPMLGASGTPVKIAVADAEDVDETIAILAELGELEDVDPEDTAAIEEALSELELSRTGSRVSASA